MRWAVAALGLIAAWVGPQLALAQGRAAQGVNPEADALKLLQPLPQNALLPGTVHAVVAELANIQHVLVVVQLGQGDDNPKWLMSHTQLAVLLNRLKELSAPNPDADPRELNPVEDAIWPQLPVPEPAYQGLLLNFQTVTGERFAPLRVAAGQILGADGQPLATDPGRKLEYWLFSTARVRRDQMLGANVLPVFTFEQCRLLGQQIVETQPRQCLLPNNNLLLESDQPPSLASAKLQTFDECLHQGQALIYTFPRRCLAPGGRVFTEPPVVWDPATGQAEQVMPAAEAAPSDDPSATEPHGERPARPAESKDV